MRAFALYLAFFFVSVVGALEVDFSCPSSVGIGEEFYCNVDVFGVEDVYDLKVYIKNDENKGVNRIFDDGDFRRADWYLKGFIESEGEYEPKLLIHKDHEGRGYGVIRLRDSSETIVFEDEFGIEIGAGEDVVSSSEEEDEIEEGDYEKVKVYSMGGDEEKVRSKSDDVGIDEDNPSFSEDGAKVIKLNEVAIEEKARTVYVSKSERVKDTLVYSFIGFLLLVVFFLLLERRK